MKHLATFMGLFVSVALFSQTPNWSEDIAPIIYNNCTKCHNQNGLAPFPLESYYNAVNWAGNIQAYVVARKMPPWPPVSSYMHYCNERVLSQTDITKISDWVNAGTPEGNEALAPPVPVFHSGPLLGTPDLKLTIPVHTSTATTADEYACFVLPTGLTQDKFVRGIQILPGNDAIVHHVIVQLDTTATATNCYLGLAGGAQTMYSWASGMSPGVYPNTGSLKMGMRIKAGSNIMVQIHYPIGSAGKVDSTSILLYLYSDSAAAAINPPMRELKEDMYVMNWTFAILPNTTQTVTAYWPVFGNTTEDLSILSIDPHMHLLGRKFITFAVTSTGDTIPLNKIDDWQYAWQSYYFFKHLIKIPTGSKIYAQAFYDNTSANIYNPFTPPQLCLPGENTTNEMLLVACQYARYEPGDENFDLETMINDAIQQATDVKEINSDRGSLSFVVYPNPSNGKFVLSSSSPLTGKAEVVITDMLGQIVFKETISNLIEPLQLDLSSVADGTYFVQLKNDKYNAVQKIVKSK